MSKKKQPVPEMCNIIQTAFCTYFSDELNVRYQSFCKKFNDKDRKLLANLHMKEVDDFILKLIRYALLDDTANIDDSLHASKVVFNSAPELIQYLFIDRYLGAYNYYRSHVLQRNPFSAAAAALLIDWHLNSDLD